MNAIIYGRVSTQNQSYQRQEQELQEYCLKEGYEIVGDVFEWTMMPRLSCKTLKLQGYFKMT